MQRVAKFIVVPYRSVRGRFLPTEPRQAISEAEAVTKAEMLSDRFPAVVAAEVLVDVETGEMDEPRILAVFGEAPAEIAEAA